MNGVSEIWSNFPRGNPIDRSTIELINSTVMFSRHPQQSLMWCTEPRCHLAIATSYILPLFLCIPSYLVFHIRATTIKENATDIVLYHLDVSDLAKENDRFLFNINFWIYGKYR